MRALRVILCRVGDKPRVTWLDAGPGGDHMAALGMLLGAPVARLPLLDGEGEPGDGSAMDEDLTGTWQLDGDVVRLSHGAPSAAGAVRIRPGVGEAARARTVPPPRRRRPRRRCRE